MAAQKFKLRSGERPYLVHGAGVKVGVRVDIDRAEKRRSVGVPEDAFVIVSAGELNKNKNTEVVVRALKNVPEAHYIACGVGARKRKFGKTGRGTWRFGEIPSYGLPDRYGRANGYVRCVHNDVFP